MASPTHMFALLLTKYLIKSAVPEMVLSVARKIFMTFF